MASHQRRRRRLRSGGRRAILAGALLGVGLLGADAALAQTGSRQSASAVFLEKRPDTPTALRFDVDYVNPANPSGKPPAVRTVVETLAQDARFDTSVPARCTAPDALLILQGASACPAGSRVGTGYLRIDTGLEPGRFLDEDIVFLNNTNELIFVTTDRANGVRVVSRSSIQGGRLTSNAPPLPGAPPDGGAIDVVQSQLNSLTRFIEDERRAYISTPISCPRDRDWVNLLSFTYADGVTQRVESQSPCDRRAQEGSKRRRCGNSWRGTRGPDRRSGTPGADRLFGFGGADRLRGGRGPDCLYGGRGPDVLRGGRGRDVLRGGRGKDVCRGGPGRDRLRGCERGR